MRQYMITCQYKLEENQKKIPSQLMSTEIIPESYNSLEARFWG